MRGEVGVDLPVVLADRADLGECCPFSLVETGRLTPRGDQEGELLGGAAQLLRQLLRIDDDMESPLVVVGEDVLDHIGVEVEASGDSFERRITAGNLPVPGGVTAGLLHLSGRVPGIDPQNVDRLAERHGSQVHGNVGLINLLQCLDEYITHFHFVAASFLVIPITGGACSSSSHHVKLAQQLK